MSDDRKRVLVTGASGLLGRAVYKELSSNPNWDTLGLAYSRATNTLRKVDLTDESQIRQVMQEFKPGVVVHCAAERRPDIVEHQEELARNINVVATSTLCHHAAKIGAYVLYVSTDYVFDGKDPPYHVDDPPNPINKYGHSKLEGEKVTMEANKENLILRVSILYGEVETLSESAVTLLFPKVKDTENVCIMSDHERRFPTHCQDVAVAINKLLTLKLQGEDIKGIFHCSSRADMTKYDMAIAMAMLFDLPTSHIHADNSPSVGTTRPYNVDLDTSRLQALGIIDYKPFPQALKECLSPYWVGKG